MHSVLRARMLAGAVTNRLMARVSAPVPASVLMTWVLPKPRTCHPPAGARFGRVSGRRVDGKNWPAELGVLQSGRFHLTHTILLLQILQDGVNPITVSPFPSSLASAPPPSSKPQTPRSGSSGRN